MLAVFSGKIQASKVQILSAGVVTLDCYYSLRLARGEEDAGTRRHRGIVLGIVLGRGYH